jgi:hypothetical protein
VKEQVRQWARDARRIVVLTGTAAGLLPELLEH